MEALSVPDYLLQLLLRLLRPRSCSPQQNPGSGCRPSGAGPARRPGQALGAQQGRGPSRTAGTPGLPARRRKAPGEGGGRPGRREAGASPRALEGPAPPQPRLQSGISPRAPARPPYSTGGPQALLGAAIVSLLPRWAPPSCALPVQPGRRHLVPSPCGVSAMAGLLCRLLLCLAAAGTGATADLLLEEARRSVDLSTHLAKVSAELSLANAAGGTAASAFLLALEPGLEPRLAYLGVQVSAGREGQRGQRPAPRGGGGAARPRALPGPRRPQGHVGTAPRSRRLPAAGAPLCSRCRVNNEAEGFCRYAEQRGVNG